MKIRSIALKTETVLLLCAALFSASLRAEDAASGKPFLNPLFSDHMVLQRDTVISIWGWTDPGKEVKVSLAGKSASATADAQGKWLAKLDPLPAGGPYTLTVTGPQTAAIQDVLVGDVWLCSGQSNMQFSVNGSKDAPAEMAAADHPQIRLFAVPRYGFHPEGPQVMYTEPQETVAAKWEVCSPKTVGGFSAVGYYFVRDLQKEVNVPIGIIRVAVDGSGITGWCARPMLETDPDLKSTLQPLETLKSLVKENKVGKEYFDSVLSDWWNANDPGTRDGWFKPDFDTSAWTKVDLSGTGGSGGLPRYNGVVWFRKEVEIPPDWAGKALKLFITGLNVADTQWFNGTQVGAFEAGWATRQSTIPGELVKAGRNVIAVRVIVNDAAFQGPSAASNIGLAGGTTSAPISLGGERLLQASTPKSKLPPLPHRLDNDFSTSTVLYNGMIAPLLPFALKGMLWYQGETPCPGGDPVHKRVLSNMIADWRARFQSPQAWFLIVQLPILGGPFSEKPDDTGCAGIRAVQWEVGHTVPNSDTAVIIDLGDPHTIHPINKQDVGKRLALIARARIYGQPVEYSGPVFKAASLEGADVRVKYDHLGGGLVVKGDKLDGFAIAGADKRWVWADAKIDGDDVIVSSPEVKNPQFLRYDFTNAPKYTLYNKADLPAAPFDIKVGQ